MTLRFSSKVQYREIAAASWFCSLNIAVVYTKILYAKDELEPEYGADRFNDCDSCKDENRQSGRPDTLLA